MSESSSGLGESNTEGAAGGKQGGEAHGQEQAGGNEEKSGNREQHIVEGQRHTQGRWLEYTYTLMESFT